MDLSNLFLNKMEQLNKISKRLGYNNFRAWADKQLEKKMINPVEFEEIDLFHQMRNIIAHGFSGRVIIFNDDIDKLNKYLKLINKELGFEIKDENRVSYKVEQYQKAKRYYRDGKLAEAAERSFVFH